MEVSSTLGAADDSPNAYEVNAVLIGSPERRSHDQQQGAKGISPRGVR